MMAELASKLSLPGREAGIAGSHVWQASAEAATAKNPLILAALVCVPRRQPNPPLRRQMMDENASNRSLRGQAVIIAPNEI